MKCVYSRCILKYFNTWWIFLCFLIISLQQNLRTKDISGLNRKHTSALTKICSHCAPSKYCIKTPQNRISFLRPFVDCQYLSAEILKAGYYRVDITWNCGIPLMSGLGQVQNISGVYTHVEQVLFTGRVLQILVWIKCEKQRIFSMFSTVVKNSNMSFCHKNFNKLNAYQREK